MTTVAAAHHQLPYTQGKHERRQQQIDHHIGDEYDANEDNQKCREHQRHVDDGSMTHLLASKTNIQREEDGLQQPCHVDDKSGTHLDEIAVAGGTYYHDDNGKKGDAHHVVEHPQT